MQGNEGHRTDHSDASSLTPGERELELALESLKPGLPAGVDRARALFDAGVAVGRRRTRAWQGAAGVMAVVFMASVLLRMPMGGSRREETSIAPGAIATSAEETLAPRTHQPTTPNTSFVIPVSVATRGASSSNENMLPPLPLPGERPGYLQLRDQVLQRGPDALRPADVAAPIWMADPAARRVLGPGALLRG